ncbi:MAG: YncE family protein [Methylocella sp.]
MLGLGLSARPAQAAPFAYVTFGSSTVSVIYTATNTVVAMVTVGSSPTGVTVTPDGKHAYVPNYQPNTVSVIDAATNTVVATIPLGTGPKEWALCHRRVGDASDRRLRDDQPARFLHRMSLRPSLDTLNLRYFCT